MMHAEKTGFSRPWIDRSVLIAVGLVLILLGIWTGDRVGWEGDDLASMFGSSYLDLVGWEQVYRYGWQPLSYEISHWFSAHGFPYLKLTYISNVMGMLGIGILIGLIHACIKARVQYALLSAIILGIAIPELLVTALYYNTTAIALPFFVSSLYLLQRVKSPADTWSIFTSGLVYGVACMFRLDFATTGLFMLVMIHLILPKAGFRPHFIWLSGTVLAPGIIFAGSPDILGQVIKIGLHFEGGGIPWSFGASIRVLLTSLGPAIVIVPLMLVTKSGLSSLLRIRTQHVLLLTSFLPMLIPLRNLYSGKYLVPILCCLIWLIARTIGQREVDEKSWISWKLRISFAATLLAMSFFMTPLPANLSQGENVLSRIVAQPKVFQTHDGYRTIGGYSHLFSWLRSRNERPSYVRLFYDYADVIEGCQDDVTVVYPRKPGFYFNDTWSWGIVPLILSSRGWELLVYDPVAEVSLRSPSEGHLLHIVSSDRYIPEKETPGKILDFRNMSIQPVDVDNATSYQNDFAAVVRTIREIHDSGICKL